MIVAITGGIGCGKSRVSSYLVKLAKAQFCDTDQYCREQLMQGQPGWQSVVAKWGRRFLDEKGDIDSLLLRRTIFDYPPMRCELEGILHPLVREHVSRLKISCQKMNRLLVVEVPLLFEVGWQNDFDKVVTVYAKKEECIRRVVDRDGVSGGETEKVIEAQMSLEDKKNLSDYIIDNSGTWKATCIQVRGLLISLMETTVTT